MIRMTLCEPPAPTLSPEEEHPFPGFHVKVRIDPRTGNWGIYIDTPDGRLPLKGGWFGSVADALLAAEEAHEKRLRAIKTTKERDEGGLTR
jgi:hypothetical protein